MTRAGPLALEHNGASSNRHPALAFCLRMSFFAKPVSTLAGPALAAVLMLGAIDARGANPPVTLDLPPSNVIPAPVEIVPGAPIVAPEQQRPTQRPNEPAGNPLWAVPLSTLTATRERPLFSPARRAPAPAVAGPVAMVPPPAPPAPAAPERPQLILVGAIASDTEGFAVFLDQATNSVVRLKTGQDHGGWVLRSVKGREATLEKDKQTTTLALPIPGAPAEALSGGQPPRPPGAPEPDL
jgi:general secretion pathway protein N